MHSQSTILGAALLVSAVLAAPTPQITTTISEPVLGWPDASVQSTQVDLQRGDRIPWGFPYGANPVTWKGQYDGECSIFRRWRGECTLDRPRWYRNWWDSYYDNDNDYYKRSVETTEEVAEPKIAKRDVEATEDAKLEKRQWYPSNFYNNYYNNNYWLWLQWLNAVRSGVYPVGSATLSGLSSSFSIDNGAPVPAYYPGWTPPSGWVPPQGYYAPAGWSAPSSTPVVGSATLSGLSSSFSVDK